MLWGVAGPSTGCCSVTGSGGVLGVVVRLLDEQALFDDLPAAVLGKLAGVIEPVEVANGQSVVRQGEHGDAYYVGRTGTFEVVAERDDGSADEVLRLVGPGESFGEMAPVDNAPRVATVQAAVPSRVFQVEVDAFDDVVRHGFKTGALRPNVAFDHP